MEIRNDNYTEILKKWTKRQWIIRESPFFSINRQIDNWLYDNRTVFHYVNSQKLYIFNVYKSICIVINNHTSLMATWGEHHYWYI